MQDDGKQPQMDPVLERALSHPKRLDMLGFLTHKGGAGADEEELAEVLDLSAPRVKYHLSVLLGADLIARADDPAQGYIATASAAQ
jgi:DNA-binding transcriptional ArsR family regulator